MLPDLSLHLINYLNIVATVLSRRYYCIAGSGTIKRAMQSATPTLKYRRSRYGMYQSPTPHLTPCGIRKITSDSLFNGVSSCVMGVSWVITVRVWLGLGFRVRVSCFSW